MGAAKINLRDYATVDKAVEMWLDVKACKGCPNATGQIKVSFTWAPELSEEEKQRRAEEARRRLYEKPDQGRSDAGDVDTIMKQAEKRLAELKAKDIGDYLKEECESNETLKMQIEEGESELEKVLDIYDDVQQYYELDRERNKLGMESTKKIEHYWGEEDIIRSFAEEEEGSTGGNVSLMANLFGGGSGGEQIPKGLAGLLKAGASSSSLSPGKEGTALMLTIAGGNAAAEKPKGLAGLLKAGAPSSTLEGEGVARGSLGTGTKALTNQQAVTKAALGNALFSSKKLDATKFVGAGSLIVGQPFGGSQRVKTPMVKVKR